MATKAKLTTKGLNEWLEAIAQAGVNIDEAAARMLEAGGDVVLDGMVRRAPELTGNLKGALTRTEPKQDGNYIYIEVGLVGADAETARYGNAQEYGTSSMAAQPYVRPALDEDMGRARKAMIDVAKQEAILT